MFTAFLQYSLGTLLLLASLIAAVGCVMISEPQPLIGLIISTVLAVTGAYLRYLSNHTVRVRA